MQHFLTPYFDVVQSDWPQALTSCLTSGGGPIKNAKACPVHALRRKDGRASTMDNATGDRLARWIGQLWPARWVGIGWSNGCDH